MTGHGRSVPAGSDAPLGFPPDAIAAAATNARAEHRSDLDTSDTFDIATGIKRAIFVALGALSLYLLHPKMIEVVSSAERFQTIHVRWFVVMLVLEALSFVCVWWLIRIVLPSVSWFVAATSQLCANAASRVVPGSAAVGGATLYRMLSVSGVGAAEAGGALAATSILSAAALFAIPATALLIALLGAPVPVSLWPAAVAGGVMFTVLVGAGTIAAAFDRPLLVLGRSLNAIVTPTSKRLRRPHTIDPQHLVAERDRLKGVVDQSWGRAIVAAAGNWAFDYLALVAALYGVGANPRLSLVLLAYAGAQVLAMIPLTPGGIGFVEAGLLYLLVISGISTQDAALATAAYRAVSFLFPIFLGAPAYLAYRFRFKDMSDHASLESSGMAELTISQIWRYPVKSLGGERLDEVEVTERGIRGDRGWGIRQLDTGHVLTARRRPELLFASAAVVDGDLTITLPDGVMIDAGADADSAAVDAALSDWLGEPVSLVAAGDDPGTYETPIDAEAEDAAPWVSWSGPTGSFHDSSKSRLSLVSEANLGDWDIRRFRTNLVLDGTGEDDLIGSTVRVGDQAELVINKAIDRCVMVTRPQPGLERDLDVLRIINRERESCLSVGGTVLTGGTIRRGDSVLRLAT